MVKKKKKSQGEKLGTGRLIGNLMVIFRYFTGYYAIVGILNVFTPNSSLSGFGDPTFWEITLFHFPLLTSFTWLMSPILI